MPDVSSSANRARRFSIYVAAASACLLAVLVALLILRPDAPGTSYSPRQSGSDQIGVPTNVQTGTEASRALAAAEPPPFVIPEGSGFELVGAQVPGKAEKGVPLLLNYTDGSKNVSLTQVLGGMESEFIPAGGDSDDTGEPYSTTRYPLTVRGGKPAIYTEMSSRSNTFDTLQWQEDDWLIILEVEEDVDDSYLLEIAEIVTQQQR